MKAEHLFDRLSQSGILVTLDTGKLVVKAAKGAMTPDFVAQIRQHKAALITFLEKQHSYQSAPNFPTIQPVERTSENLYPVSFNQQRLWFIHQISGNSANYNIPMAFIVEGELDFAAAQIALTQIVQRHEILRTSYHEVAGTPMQSIHDASKFAIQFFDITQLPLEQQLNRAKQIAAEDERKAFELDKDFMIRAGYVQLSPLNHKPRSVLLLNVHHIAFDGWSLGILLQEFSENYQACLRGEPEPRAKLAIQYLDFAAWQQDNFNEISLQKQLDYWQKQLVALPESHGLYTPAMASTEKSNKSQFDSQLPVSVAKKMHVLCQQFNTSPFIFIHAVFSILLARHSGRSDIVIGTPVANRLVNQLEPLLGFFVNSLVLRTSYQPQQCFTEYLAYVCQVNLNAQANQDVPFEKLVERCAPTCSRSHSPLFQIMLSMNSNDSAVLPIPGVDIKPLKQPEPGLKFDIELNVAMTGDSVAVKWTFNSELFDVANIRVLDSHFHNLFAEVVKDPTTPLHELSILSDTEKLQILTAVNNTPFNGEHFQSLIELFHRQVASTPDKIALICEQEQISYTQLDNYANQFATYLSQKAQQPYIGICLHRSFELLVAILAVWKIGKAYVPIHPDTPKALIQHIIATADLELIISSRQLCDTTLADLSPVLDINLTTLAANASFQHGSYSCQYQANDPAYVIFTSGSTGVPKGVVVEHKGLINLAYSMQQLINSESASAWGWTASCSFDASVQGVTQLMLGQPLAVISDAMKMDPQALHHFVLQNYIGILDCTPSLLELWRPLGLENLPDLIIGGEAIHENLWQELADRKAKYPDRKAFNVYGPTECSVNSSWTEINHGTPHIGQAIPNTLCLVMDQDGNLAPTGAVGELAIAGVGLARGYLKDEALTAKKFIPNRFHEQYDSPRLYRTGDLVRRLSNGNIEFVGRADNQVKIRGYRIELDEIHKRVAECASVESCLIVAEGDNEHKRIVAYVQLKEHEVDAAQLLTTIAQQLRATLQPYMLPAAWGVVTQWPLTINGKIDKARLPTPQLAGCEGAITHPQTETEGQLRQIWSQLLSLPEELISVTNSFFDLGGHSLLAVRLVGKINQEIHKAISVRSVFEYPTVRSMAAAVDAQTPLELMETLRKVPQEGRYLDTSFAQQRMWFIDQMQGGSADYNMPMALKISGNFKQSIANNALKQITQRHRVLRCIYQQTPQGLRQLDTGLSIPVAFRDFSHLGTKEKLAQLQLLLDEDASRSFVLESELPVRVTLVILQYKTDKNAAEFALLFNMHHSISDGISCQILIREFCTIYNGMLQKEKGELPQLSVQYSDYAHWQQQKMQNGGFEKSLAYWKKQLSGVPLTHSLDLFNQRPDVRKAKGERLQQRLSGCDFQQIQSLSRHYNVTPFMLLQGLFALLIARHSNSTDIVIGTPVGNRTQHETESLIGMFVNTIALRVDTHQKTLSEYFNHVKQVHVNGLEHQELPFEQVVDALKIPRSNAYNPLFQIMFTLDPQLGGNSGFDDNELALCDCQIHHLSLNSVAAKFDLDVSCQVRDETLFLTWTYDSCILNRSQVQRMTGHFENMLNSLLNNAAIHTSALNMLSQDEIQQLLKRAEKAATNDDNQDCVHHLFSHIAAKQPDAIAVEFGESKLSYQALELQSDALAEYLIIQGAKPHSIVGLYAGRSEQLVVAILGVLKTGAAFLPIDPRYPAERIQYMVENSGAQQVLCLTQSMDIDVGTALKLSMETALAQCNHGSARLLPLSLSSPQDTAYVIYTSGSTGQPKGVAVSHKNWRSYAGSIHKHYELAQERVLQNSSISFDMFIEELSASLLTGGTLVIPKAECAMSCREFWQFVKHHEVSFASLPTAYWHLLSADSSLAEDTAQSPLKTVITGGEEMSALRLQHWQAHASPKIRLFNTYGPTEATVIATFVDVTRLQPVSDRLPIGKPIAAGYTLILDRDKNLVPDGVPGELYLGGTTVSQGYINNAELSKEKFIISPWGKDHNDKIYKTGDLVKCQQDGSIVFLGRIDTQVKVNGFLVEPIEIEAVFAGHDLVSECVVVPQKSAENWRIYAYVTLQRKTGDANICKELASYARTKLPAYMNVDEVMVLDEWPLGVNGKIDKSALPEPQRAAVDVELIPLANEFEIGIAQLWARLMRLDMGQIGGNSHFFELGGHSLLAVQLASLLKSEMFVVMPIKALFENPVLSDLAKNLHGQSESNRVINGYSCMSFSEAPELPHLFVAPAMGMTGAAYQGYAAQLAISCNVHILTTPGIDELIPIDSPLLKLSYEQRIESWFKTIKEKQSSGHYRLAGHSLGGDFAISLAHKLEQNGDSAEVILVDSVLGLHANSDLNKQVENLEFYEKVGNVDNQHMVLYQLTCHNQLALVPTPQFKHAVINKISVIMAQDGLAKASDKDAVLQRIQARSVLEVKQSTCKGDHLSILKHQDVADQTLLLFSDN